MLIDSCSTDFDDKTSAEYTEFNKLRIQKTLSQQVRDFYENSRH